MNKLASIILKATTGNKPMKFDIDDVFHFKEISYETKRMLSRKLSEMSIKDVTYGLQDYSIKMVVNKNIYEKIKATNEIMLYLDTVCRFRKPSKDRMIVTTHKIYTIGHDGFLYKIELSTYVRCRFLSKFYDSEIIAITSVIAQDLIEQNNKFSNLTPLSISIPDYSDLMVVHKEDYSSYLVISTNNTIKDGVSLSMEEMDTDAFKFMDISDKSVDQPITKNKPEERVATTEDDPIVADSSEVVHILEERYSVGDTDTNVTAVLKQVPECVEDTYDGRVINFSDINRQEVTLKDVLDMMKKDHKE